MLVIYCVCFLAFLKLRELQIHTLVNNIFYYDIMYRNKWQLSSEKIMLTDEHFYNFLLDLGWHNHFSAAKGRSWCVNREDNCKIFQRCTLSSLFFLFFGTHKHTHRRERRDRDNFLCCISCCFDRTLLDVLMLKSLHDSCLVSEYFRKLMLSNLILNYLKRSNRF